MPKNQTKREMVVRAALELFVQRGVEATTIRAIARRAGAAEGTLYRHYAGKEEMAEALFHEQLAGFMTALNRAVSDCPDLPEQLEAVVGTFYRFYEEDPTLFSYLLLSEHQFIRSAPPETETPVHLLIEILEAARDGGRIQDQPVEFSAAVVFGTVLRVALFRVYGRITDDLRNLVTPVTHACLRSVNWKEAA